MKDGRIVILVLLISLAFVCSCKQAVTKAKSAVDAPQNDQLKELAYFVGTWTDTDENDKVISTFRWDTNKTFLLHHFISQTSEKFAFEGHQIIGWDPVKKKIRSWVFDSDGGFGESYWEKQDDNSWYASMLFTLPDGKRGSATQIYAKINDKSYSFSSTNRDVDGQMLPDIGPFTVVREKS